MNDILVVVPPGTRVRYIESPYTDGKVMVLDAELLQSGPIIADFWQAPAALTGVPIYEAERYLDE